ncbi:MAG: hypothetical protein JRG91_00220 [Deltaproteobacteria bacterium]|nr:hypothetical protein [Deltaproteobacteria bacterium]
MNTPGLLVLCLCLACAACGPKSSSLSGTTTSGEASITEVQDVLDDETVAVEETTLETVEDEDEEMAPPEG